MKILIADDEMGVKTLFKHFMEQYPSPYTEYKMVSTGEELRNTCLQEAFDIVFSDIKMPGLTGLEAIYEIKNASESDTTSYYIISGYEEFEFAQQAIRLGIKDYILKPVRYSVIEEILRKEEEKLFLGLSLEDAWAMHDKEAAMRLSQAIQDLAASYVETYKSFYSSLTGWRDMAGAKKIPIESDYFKKWFDTECDTFDKQYKFLEEATLSGTDGSYSKELMLKIVSQIDANYRNPSLGLDMIADQLGYSTQYLSMIFSKETGTPFSLYLTKKRIENAKRLLSTTKMKIKDIAGMCGYSYTSYFIKVFRKETGSSPAEWRDGPRKQ